MDASHRYRPAPLKWVEAAMLLKNLAMGALMASALVMAGCGTSPGDRAVSGGLLGAGAGAAIGSVTGSAGTGAIIGGVAGAAIGAATDPCDLDLGDPFWRQHGGQRGYTERCGHRPPHE
jgi:O-antigen ligase